MPHSIRLTLCDYHDHSQEFTLEFTALQTPAALRYLTCLQNVVDRGASLYHPDRLYAFPKNPVTAEMLLARMQKSIDLLAEHLPELREVKLGSGLTQDQNNALHTIFEKHRGPLLNPSDFYKNASWALKDALDELNLAIHRYEDCGYALDHDPSRMLRSVPKITLCFGLNEIAKRYPLHDEDFQHFHLGSEFGGWYINYCEVGKPLHDLWRDQDAHIGAEVVKPLHWYSADGLILFGHTDSQEMIQNHLRDFHLWWDQNSASLEGMGFTKYDPRNAIGTLQVGRLNRQAANIVGLTENEIINKIADYQYIKRVETSLSSKHLEKHHDASSVEPALSL